MKKLGIGSIVGALILFIWQFLSWSILDIHRPNQSYTPKQAEVLKYLDENLPEGNYYMPTYPKGTSQEEAGKMMTDALGKPWAQVYMHKAMNMNMGANMGRGVFVNIIALLILIWMLMKMGKTSFLDIILCCVGVGLIGYLTITYTYSIWYLTHTLGDLLDAFVSWGLVGAWLGWWLNKN